MPSPFPGMNPYLEHPHVWHDFHQTYIPAAREALAPLVRPKYFIRVDREIYFRKVDEDELILTGKSDLDVVELDAGSTRNGESATSTLLAPTEVVMPEFDDLELAYLGIYTNDDKRLVTVIELLSPANKGAGPDRDRYLRKRRRLLETGVNFIELDFLRGGPRLEPADRKKCDYYALVSRPIRLPKADFWPLKLQSTLPKIPVPLALGEADVELDLQAVLHRVYDGASYEQSIYENTIVPRLPPADAAWAAEILAAAGIAAGSSQEL